MHASIKLRKLRFSIASKLLEIEDLVGPDYQLTLVARHATNPDAHIIVSCEKDDALLSDVRDVLRKLIEDPNSIVSNRPVGFEQYVPEGSYVAEDADGERFVRK